MKVDFGPMQRVKYMGTRKITAIKTLRDMFGLGLKEAKDLVDAETGFDIPERLIHPLRLTYVDITYVDIDDVFDGSYSDFRIIKHISSYTLEV